MTIKNRLTVYGCDNVGCCETLTLTESQVERGFYERFGWGSLDFEGLRIEHYCPLHKDRPNEVPRADHPHPA